MSSGLRAWRGAGLRSRPLRGEFRGVEAEFRGRNVEWRRGRVSRPECRAAFGHGVVLASEVGLYVRVVSMEKPYPLNF
jgi:hypothetical protein